MHEVERLETLAQRLKHARKLRKMTQQTLEKLSGAKQSDLSKLERGDSQATTKIVEIAAALNVDPAWLASGDGRKPGASDSIAETSHARTSNVEPGPDLKGMIPSISWVQAGDWHGAEDPLSPGEAEMWMPSPVKCSPGSFALRVRGDSMTAVHGNSRSYPEGSIIFVDPERCMPNNGDRIVARLVGSDDVTFKIYKNEDGRQWLQPLNPTHEPIREPFKVIGSVVGTWTPE